MDKWMHFFTILAWIAAVVSTLLFFLFVYLTTIYSGSIDELRDNLKGVRREYPGGKALIIAIISWAFIIAFW